MSECIHCHGPIKDGDIVVQEGVLCETCQDTVDAPVCDGCGERSISSHTVEGIDYCPECYEERPTCPACHGSGEGRADGDRCISCHGRGVGPSPKDIEREMECE